jgi:hypothetical protein
MPDVDPFSDPPMWIVLADVEDERARQDAKFGEQNPPDGTSITYAFQRDAMRKACDRAFAGKVGTWRHILAEEFFEALAEVDPVALRTELIQVSAVCVAWCEAIDRRLEAQRVGSESQYGPDFDLTTDAVPHD